MSLSEELKHFRISPFDGKLKIILLGVWERFALFLFQYDTFQIYRLLCKLRLPESNSTKFNHLTD